MNKHLLLYAIDTSLYIAYWILAGFLIANTIVAFALDDLLYHGYMSVQAYSALMIVASIRMIARELLM